MKYTQLVMGLLVGTALGSAVIAATGTGAKPSTANGAALDADAIKAIVRQTIADEPKLILDSVQKYQEAMHNQDVQSSSAALKDPATHDAVFNPKIAATFGPKDAKKVVVEFFDYNCPVCKMQYKVMQDVLAKDKSVKFILREFPIFGPSSDFNSQIGLAILINHPDKYQGYFSKMLAQPGHGDEKAMLQIVKELGLDIEQLKKESTAPEVAATLKENQALGEKLHIQGTPTLIIGDEMIPHALSPEDVISKASAVAAAPAPAAQ